MEKEFHLHQIFLSAENFHYLRVPRNRCIYSLALALNAYLRNRTVTFYETLMCLLFFIYWFLVAGYSL